MTGHQRIGVFGGTFDPIHIGHLALAESIGQALTLDRVIFYPAGSPPHKPGKSISDVHHRFAMVQLAIAGNSRFAISDVDMAGNERSYTVDLLRTVRERLAEATLEFIIGADSLRDFPTWHDPEGILRLSRLAVGERPGVEINPDAVIAKVPSLKERLDLVKTARLDISATDIRQRVHDGQSICYLVPEPVWRYIQSNRLYLPSTGQAGDSAKPSDQPEPQPGHFETRKGNG